MHANQRASAFAIQIEIADKELLARTIELRLIVSEDGARESVLRIVRDA